jgi:hypothetical protein
MAGRRIRHASWTGYVADSDKTGCTSTLRCARCTVRDGASPRPKTLRTMRGHRISLAGLLPLLQSSLALPRQLTFTPSLASTELGNSLLSGDDAPETGVGHLSEWARLVKQRFINEMKHDNATDSQWVLVAGNEAVCLRFSLLLWSAVDGLTGRPRLAHLGPALGLPPQSPPRTT